MKKDWEIRHLGFIVSDMDRAIDYYKSLGIVTVTPDTPLMEVPNGGKVKVKFTQIGSLDLVFFQPVEGESMQLQFLRKHGEGIQHMAFAVTDIDTDVNDLLSKGVKLMFRGDMPNGSRIAYFDTNQIGDVLTELVQPAEKEETRQTKKDWKIRHLGFIVSDMDRAIDYYKSMGIATAGPELPIAESPDGSKLKVRFAQIGSLVLEFFQPVEGESMQLQFLRKHGEGIQHMAFTVADIDAEVDDLLSKGVKLIFRGDMQTGSRIAYFDTGQIGDFLIEIVQPAEKDGLTDFLKPTE